MLKGEMRTSASEPVENDSHHIDWTLALAGGDGVRLAEYVERRFGQRIPKQYCRLLGRRSMLEHTLDRLNTVAPASRTLTIIGTTHGGFASDQLAGRSDHVFCQPSSRDTGVALYVALAMIKRWNPHAVVTITPTDHYVAPAHRYIEQVRAAQQVASQLRDTVVIVGARPTEPDPELGYLSHGTRLSQIPHVRRLVGFVEKPSVVRASEIIAGGGLWNTMVTCATIDALWALGQAAQPQLLDILDSLVPLIGSEDEADAIAYIYRTVPPVSFSRDILERAPERLAATALEGVEWSDWGRPERIETVLALRRTRALVPEMLDRVYAP
jgi:mannose-1-phosphate guanylyltransferase